MRAAVHLFANSAIRKYLTSSQVVTAHVEQIKEELSGIFEEMARRMLDSISPEDIQKINAYQRTISAGVCTDKYRDRDPLI